MASDNLHPNTIRTGKIVELTKFTSTFCVSPGLNGIYGLCAGCETMPMIVPFEMFIAQHFAPLHLNMYFGKGLGDWALQHGTHRMMCRWRQCRVRHSRCVSCNNARIKVEISVRWIREVFTTRNRKDTPGFSRSLTPSVICRWKSKINCWHYPYQLRHLFIYLNRKRVVVVVIVAVTVVDGTHCRRQGRSTLFAAAAHSRRVVPIRQRKYIYEVVYYIRTYAFAPFRFSFYFLTLSVFRFICMPKVCKTKQFVCLLLWSPQHDVQTVIASQPKTEKENEIEERKKNPRSGNRIICSSLHVFGDCRHLMVYPAPCHKYKQS